MRLTYWYSQCPDDSNVYSIRTKTKREALAQIAKRDGEDWPKPIKVSLQYVDSFDLLEACSNEGHHFWEAKYNNDSVEEPICCKYATAGVEYKPE